MSKFHEKYSTHILRERVTSKHFTCIKDKNINNNKYILIWTLLIILVYKHTFVNLIIMTMYFIQVVAWYITTTWTL